jgi:hypothetical protein
MSIPVRCTCGYSADVPDSFAGKRGKCKRCGEFIRIPALRPESRDIVVDTEEPAAYGAASRTPDLPAVVAVPAPASYPSPAPRAPAPVPTRPNDDIAGKGPVPVLCPFCAEPIQARAKKCKHCGEYLDPVLRAKHSPPAQPQIIVNNTATATAISGRGRKRFSPLVAFFLSLILPGAGQLYKGQPINAIVWFVVVLIGYLAFIAPGAILHVCCVIGAASGDPYA